QRQCGVDGIEKRFVVEWLLDEIDRTAFHRLHRGLHISPCGHRDHRHVELKGVEPLLQLQSIHFRHYDIKEKASVAEARRRIEKCERSLIRYRRQSRRAEGTFE